MPRVLEDVDWAIRYPEYDGYPLSADARLIATASPPSQYATSGSVRIQNVANGNNLWSVKLPFVIGRLEPRQPHSGFHPRRLAFSMNGDLVGAVLRQESEDPSTFRKTEADQLRVWHVPTGREVGSFNSGFSVDPGLERERNAQRDLLALSPDGRNVAWMSRQGSIHLWDMRTGSGPDLDLPDAVQIAFSPDGTRFAAVLGYVWVWDVNNGKQVLELHGMEGVAFSPDGKALAAYAQSKGSSEIDCIKVWDATSGQEIATLPFADRWSYGGRPAVLCFTPDGKRLAANCKRKDYVGAIWDLTTRKECSVLVRARGSPVCFAFSRDGKKLHTMNSTWDINDPE